MAKASEPKLLTNIKHYKTLQITQMSVYKKSADSMLLIRLATNQFSCLHYKDGVWVINQRISEA